MPTECSQDSLDFGTVEGREVVAAFDGGAITSDAGALLLGQTNKAICLTKQFAACFTDARLPEATTHSVETMIGQIVYGLCLGYEDLVDHDQLRHDPMFAVLAGKLQSGRKDCAPVAGKSTLNRLQLSLKNQTTRYCKIGHDPAAIAKVFVQFFLKAHASKPRAPIILDLDATHSVLHGEQEGRFFQGYYDCYCYLPLLIFCGRHLLAAKLRTADRDAADGALDPHVAEIEIWLAAEPRITALVILDRLVERCPNQFGPPQQSIVQRRLKVLRRQAAKRVIEGAASTARSGTAGIAPTLPNDEQTAVQRPPGSPRTDAGFGNIVR